MSKATGDLVSAFNVDEAAGPEVNPSWNVAPTQRVRLVADRINHETGEMGRRLETVRWGLVPSWAKDPKMGGRMINARMETITEKPSFRTAASKRRALVPADGYYEWQKHEDGTKTPTYLHPERDELLAFAGLFEFWPDPSLPDGHEDKWLVTCTIITTTATDTLGHIHDRTPLIVPADLQRSWLDPTLTGKDEVRELLDSIPAPSLVPRIVGDEVGPVRNDGPHLIEPVSA